MLGLIIAANNNRNSLILLNRKGAVQLERQFRQMAEENISFDEGCSFFQEIKYLWRADLVFGTPKGISKLILRLLCVFSSTRYNVNLRPGKVTKPSGFIAGHLPNLYKVAKNWMSYRFFNTRTIVADRADFIYCVSCYLSIHQSLIIYPSPKDVYLSNAINQGQKNRNLILFAPTHRDRKTPSPLDILLMDRKYIERFERHGFEVAYSRHRAGFDIGNADYSPQEFNGDWERVSCVVTDYSSIGPDLSRAGLKVLFYIPDYTEFFRAEGSSFFYDLDLSDKKSFSNSEDLMSEIVGGAAEQPSVVSLDSYFENLINVLKKSNA